MPNARVPIRSTKSRNRPTDPLRSLYGRTGYLPVRTGQSRGTSRLNASPFPDQPPDWPGTLPEWAIYWAHLSLGLREGRDFGYVQRDPNTGIQVDFTEYDVNVGIQVQGVFWHYQFQNRPINRDHAQRAELESLGVTVVWIDENSALANPVFFLKAAREGRDYSQGIGF